MRQIKVSDPEHAQMFQVQLAVKEMNDEQIEQGQDPVLLESRDGGLVKPRMSGDELVELSAEALGTVLRTCVEPVQNKPPRAAKAKIPVPKEMKDETEDEERDPDPGGEPGDDKMSDKPKEIVILPSVPIRLVKAYLGTKDWPGVPRIIQTARAPIVRPDWSVRWEPGYDEETGCWVTTGVSYDPIMLGLDLRTVFGQFALARPEFVADLLAAALTPYLTTAIDAPYPGLLIAARAAGSGKTYLAQLVGLLGGCGALPEVTGWKGPDHMSNAITSAVKSDDRLVIFDNIKGEIDSPELEAVITGRGIKERRFHTQENMRLRSNTSWFMTANGAAASIDMVRRCITVLLDKEENPALWDGAVIPWAMEYEAALVTKMVGMIEDWRNAGAPPGSLRYPGFERWSVAVSGILEHAGYTDLWKAREMVLDTAVSTASDDDADLLTRLARVMGDTSGWTAGDLFDRVQDMSSPLSLNGDFVYVRKWMDTVARGKKAPGMAIGHALSKLVGNPIVGASHTLRKTHREYTCIPVPVNSE